MDKIDFNGNSGGMSMIKIVEQNNKSIATLQCTNCHGNTDVKIISLQYDNFSKNIIPLCRECRSYLLKLLICDMKGE